MIFKICLKRLRYSVYALFALTLCYRFAERWDSGAPPTLAERIVWFIQDESSLVKSLTGRKKARFFAFRLLGFALIAAGCALMVSERIVWATLAFIAGVALIYSAAD